MLLSIIILSYNTKELTLQCLESVISEIKQAKLLDKSEILVTDNASTDGSAPEIGHYLRLHDVSHQVIANTKNLGFPKGNNQAISLAKGSYILLLNSDTVVQRGCFTTLLASMEAHPVKLDTSQLKNSTSADRLGILAATLSNPDSTPQSQGGDLPTLLGVFAQWSGLDDMPVLGKLLLSPQHTGRSGKKHDSDAAEQILPMGWVGATAMLVRKEVFREIGMLDESIFMYGEDVEFCLRARNHHWDVGIDPKAKVVHIGSASSSSENAIIGEITGLQYIWSKHKPAWQTPLLKLLLRLGVIIRIGLFGIILHDEARARSYRKALMQL